ERNTDIEVWSKYLKTAVSLKISLTKIQMMIYLSLVLLMIDGFISKGIKISNWYSASSVRTLGLCNILMVLTHPKDSNIIG
ncbi:MAG: hypothetical protein ACIWVG_08000, partial [Gloeotrichia echinulata HAB0833]